MRIMVDVGPATELITLSRCSICWSGPSLCPREGKKDTSERRGRLTWYIGDLIRWRRLWNGREFHRGLSGKEGREVRQRRERNKRERGAVALWGSPSLLPRLNCLNSIPFTSFVASPSHFLRAGEEREAPVLLCPPHPQMFPSSPPPFTLPYPLSPPCTFLTTLFSSVFAYTPHTQERMPSPLIPPLPSLSIIFLFPSVPLN